MKITDAEKKALKGRGYIMTRDGEHFIARLITVDGVLTSEQFTVAAEAAEKFGNGRLAMTSRLTIEVQGLTYDTIEPFNKYIAKAVCTPVAPAPGCGLLWPVRAPCASTASSTPRDWPGAPREILQGLVRCKAAPQVQNWNRRLPQQLYQALPQ